MKSETEDHIKSGDFLQSLKSESLTYTVFKIIHFTLLWIVDEKMDSTREKEGSQIKCNILFNIEKLLQAHISVCESVDSFSHPEKQYNFSLLC